MPRIRTAWMWIPAGPTAPRAAAMRLLGRRIGRPLVDAAAMRSAVAIAVPEGASTLPSWCSSMISAVSKNGAASSLNRISSTAEIEKLAATRTWPLSGVAVAAANVARSSSVKPVVPTTTWMP